MKKIIIFSIMLFAVVSALQAQTELKKNIRLYGSQPSFEKTKAVYQYTDLMGGSTRKVTVTTTGCTGGYTLALEQVALVDHERTTYVNIVFSQFVYGQEDDATRQAVYTFAVYTFKALTIEGRPSLQLTYSDSQSEGQTFSDCAVLPTMLYSSAKRIIQACAPFEKDGSPEDILLSTDVEYLLTKLCEAGRQDSVRETFGPNDTPDPELEDSKGNKNPKEKGKK